MGRFVGVGIDSYEAHEPLAHAVAEIKAVAEVLGQEFAGEPLLDPDHAQVTEYLQAVRGCLDTGPLVLMWCGHGVLSRSRLRLPARRGEIDAAEVIYQCAASGANQLLFIVDTCQAGAGVGEASAIASALLEDVSVKVDHAWFGILVSCSATDIGARDGEFGAALLRLLTQGPQSADMRRRWSRHNRLIRGDDLGQALLEDWDGEDQRPDFLRRGSAWYMLPNPLWDPGAPEEVVEHLLLAARGGDSADHRSWFTGREAEVDRVVSWVDAGVPGVRVVTGSAGTGKSAIVGRVVSLSNPTERRRLERSGPPWRHADPGERSVAAHVHARGLTAERMAELLDGQLVGSGVLAPGDGDRRNAAELVGAVQRAVQEGARPPVVVIDGLDEARGEMFTIAADLLVRLAPYASLVVSTRPVPRAEPPPSLIEALQADSVLDVDDPERRESGRAALRGYVVARLSGVAAEMDPAAVADRLVGESSQTEDRPFLLARVVTDQLRAAPIDTSTPNWERYLASSIESAFRIDLARVTQPGIGLPPGTSPAGLASTMLTALTWAFGAGFPEEEWIAIASRLAEAELGRDHVSWVLDGLGRYVVQDGEGGTAVYRVAHQSLADHLRPSYRRTGERPFDPAAEVVWSALAARYTALLASGHSALAPAYLWRYAYRHAAAVGIGGLPALRELASTVDELRSAVGLAALEVAEVLATWGRHVEAVAPTEEAVALYRGLAADYPAYTPHLAGALTNLGICYDAVGRQVEAVIPTEEAVTLYRHLTADNPANTPDLAVALTNLGLRYDGVGRQIEAVTPTEEALALYQHLAEDNPAYVPDLAGTLSNLGICYGGVGRRAEAVAPTEKAVTLYRHLAADNPANAPDLAMALSNLGRRYGEVGRHAEAVTPTEEAATFYRHLAKDNPAYAPNLAGTLSNLGIHYREVGRRAEAVAPTEEAVALRREQTAENPAHASDLAAVLTNLGLCYSEVGRWAEAVAPTEEAVARYRHLAADNRAYTPDLAMALSNLGGRYGEVGRWAEAVAPTEEAVARYRHLAADNRAYTPDLAMALSNLGIHYSKVGRRADSMAPTEEAVARYRDLAAENPVYTPDLAMALTNLGAFYREMGHRTHAVAPTADAVTLYRHLTTDNPAFAPNLAAALTNLGVHYREVGLQADAVAATEEAVALYRHLTTDNSAYVPGMAAALNNLGKQYSKADRRADAVTPAEEAVALYRQLTTNSPAYAPELAKALNNVSIYYREVGRRAEAVAPTEEAVALYQQLTADNPAFAPNLAAALTNLEWCFVATGDVARAEALWQQVLADHDPLTRATLLLHRASAADPGDPQTAAWLVDACRSDDRGLRAAAHHSARTHRDANPESWDAVWTQASGAQPPEWLTIDSDLLAVATAWIETRTYAEEHDHLAAHPELLDPHADTAIDEALLPIEDNEADHYRQLRARAQTEDVTAAYRPLFLRLLADQFAAASPAEQRELLTDRRAELLEDVVRHHLDSRAEADETGEVTRAVALLKIATQDADGSILSATFDALDKPSAFPELLDTTARDTGSVATALQLMVTIALTAATTEPEAAVAGLYLAIAAAVAGELDQATEWVSQALAWDPGSASAWIAQLAQLGAVQPAVLPLITVLAQAGHDGEH